MLQTVKNAIVTISDKRKRTVWLRAFRIWQRRPHEVAPLSEATHECASCATVFQGNYCPRCGQSAQIGRFSFKKAFKLFLDVWGIGNRSMTRTIRDLLLRPGYMIRDYLKGMQSAYFPPFKMFFLLAALSLLVQHGFSLKDDRQQESAEVTSAIFEDDDDQKSLSKEEQEAKDEAKMAFTVYFYIEYDRAQEPDRVLAPHAGVVLFAALLFHAIVAGHSRPQVFRIYRGTGLHIEHGQHLFDYGRFTALITAKNHFDSDGYRSVQAAVGVLLTQGALVRLSYRSYFGAHYGRLDFSRRISHILLRRRRSLLVTVLMVRAENALPKLQKYTLYIIISQTIK